MLQYFDLPILQFIRTHIVHPALDPVMSFLDFHGFGIPLCILIGAVLLCIRRTRKYGLICLAAVAVTGLVNLGIKELVARPRPFISHDLPPLILPPVGYSFPSGHTQQAFTVATVLLFANKKLGVIAMAVASLVGFSRMYVGVHYPTDVLVGALLGIAIGFLVDRLIDSWLTRRKQSRSVR
ncbi:phosphatase PAP2 family protein [Candidatus Soleaferrea massiliensis]|uniref:phosphatase PAP2 family protein n=1 Tax=Candidatus Soleaferrea massiliensis TaxID=1470354 RepID=UPI0005909954|nr:phosphatase PAP2 family protein [Candidatus Soleaferrea massiliensis]